MVGVVGLLVVVMFALLLLLLLLFEIVGGEVVDEGIVEGSGVLGLLVSSAIGRNIAET